ncbi:hypothetical protein PPM_p0162 (plasmid) [Paenibacillus polymyxa M1]|uniref:hypothetical protein n=1 Tax=Paenibacillus polymyxa TaxID=1406 RepID=UPI00021BBB8E|nr:hypothetical protein [Paenibacillus polymyxa]CCC86312.1 hypothetical protein PPM_p0162 [Paenibacillus polymyxa M1]
MYFIRFFWHTIKLIILYLFITLIIPSLLNVVIPQQLEKDGSISVVNDHLSTSKVSTESEQSKVSNQNIFKAMQSLIDFILHFLKPLLFFGILASFTLNFFRFMLWFYNDRLVGRESRGLGLRVPVLRRPPFARTQHHDQNEQRQPSVADALDNLIQSHSNGYLSINETCTEQPDINLNKNEIINEKNFFRTIRDLEPAAIPDNDSERESSAFKRVIRL